MVQAPETHETSDVARVVEFRNRLVAYLNEIQAQRGQSLHGYEDRSRWNAVAQQQSSLAQAYGRLRRIINRHGVMRMGSRAAGITSHDVIQDAISDVGNVYHDDLARISVQHMDNVIGIMQDENGQQIVSHDDLYRLTSPVFWLGRLWALMRWTWGSTRRRVIAFVGAIVLAVATELVTGWARALLSRL